MQTDETKKVMVVRPECKPGTLFLQIRETNTHEGKGKKKKKKASIASAYYTLYNKINLHFTQLRSDLKECPKVTQ